MNERLRIAGYFVTARWLRRFRTRDDLLAWQERKIDAFLRDLVKRSGFYRGHAPRLDDLPVMDKALFREQFAGLNPAGISLDEAEVLALKAEQERDFSPVAKGDITVGLSSGTSGRRGVFLASGDDRVRWAGIIFARVLSRESLKHLLAPWRRPLRIAFFLRANSNLYETLGSGRVDFRYFDLLRGMGVLVEELEAYLPDVLVAPSTVLAELARKVEVTVKPRQVVSVAEVLDDRDAGRIEAKFGVRPENLYQAMEGFIASTCAEGRLHLNEEFLHVGCEWLDESETRFHPVITDFSRTTQWVVRYRLDDVLVADDGGACPCGRVSRTIRRIEGRADEILWFGDRPVFPDLLRQALYAMPVAIDLYRLEQHGKVLRVMLRESSPELEGRVGDALHGLFTRLGTAVPEMEFILWSDQPAGEKQRRIRCVTKPSSPP